MNQIHEIADKLDKGEIVCVHVVGVLPDGQTIMGQFGTQIAPAAWLGMLALASMRIGNDALLPASKEPSRIMVPPPGSRVQ